MLEQFPEDMIPSLIQELLELPYWPPELCADTMYARLHDDTDGEDKGCIGVLIDKFGDVRVASDACQFEYLRFRTDGGGGRSLRTRNALLFLALAIKLDNEERPDCFSKDTP